MNSTISRSVFLGISVVLAALIFQSCSKKDNPVQTKPLTPAFYGTVVDSAGDPIQDAEISFIPHFKNTLAKNHVKRTPSSFVLSFDVPVAGDITVVLYRFGTGEVIDTVTEDEPMDPGINEVDFNYYLTNAIYVYKIFEDGALIGQDRFILAEQDPNYITLADPLVYTDSAGHFSLPYLVFGIGQKLFNVADVDSVRAQTVTISNVLDIVYTGPGYTMFTKQFTIDQSQATVAKFILN